MKLLCPAVRVAPKHDGAHDNLARVLRETGNPKAALHHRARHALATPSAASHFVETLKLLCRIDDAAKAAAEGDRWLLGPTAR